MQTDRQMVVSPAYVHFVHILQRTHKKRLGLIVAIRIFVVVALFPFLVLMRYIRTVCLTPFLVQYKDL